jgi:hypothetical protein
VSVVGNTRAIIAAGTTKKSGRLGNKKDTSTDSVIKK